MKQKLKTSDLQSKKQSQLGFTLVELLAVMAIMTLILGALVIDFASQRGTRNVILAKNEIATNLRKVQSYMLSSKNLSTGESVKYYIATFTSNSTSYTIDAIDSNYVYHSNIETVKLPNQVQIFNIQTVSTSTGSGGGGPVRGGQTGQIIATDYKCMQIIFSAPFGKMYTNGADSCSSSIKDILQDPVQRAALSEKTAKIYFAEIGSKGVTNYMEVNPVTGQLSTY